MAIYSCILSSSSRPESLGIVCGAFYLVTVFTYIPFNFLKIDFNHLNLIGRFRLVYPILKSAEFEQSEVTIRRQPGV